MEARDNLTFNTSVVAVVFVRHVTILYWRARAPKGVVIYNMLQYCALLIMQDINLEHFRAALRAVCSV